MLKNLQYERIAQLMAIAAIDKHDLSAANKLGIRSAVATSSGEEHRAIAVSFSAYVKSQIHLCVAEDLYGRSMLDYIEALKYLDGYAVYRRKAAEVLQYFYLDMAHFLINNPYNIHLSIDADIDFECEVVDVAQVRSQLLSILDTSDADDLYAKISAFPYAGIIDSINNVEDARKKIDSYTVASILGVKAAEPIIKGLRLGVDNED